MQAVCMPLSPRVDLTLTPLCLSHPLGIHFFPSQTALQPAAQREGRKHSEQAWAQRGRYHPILCLVLEDHSNLNLSPQHGMSTLFSHSREKSKFFEHQPKGNCLAEMARSPCTPAASAGAMRCSIPLLAAGPSQSSLGEELGEPFAQRASQI